MSKWNRMYQTRQQARMVHELRTQNAQQQGGQPPKPGFIDRFVLGVRKPKPIPLQPPQPNLEARVTYLEGQVHRLSLDLNQLVDTLYQQHRGQQ